MKNKNVSCVVKKDAEIEIKKHLQKLRSILEKLDQGILTFHYGGRPVRAQKSDIVRIISRIKPDSKLELGIRNIFLEAIMTAESLSPGSGYLVLRGLFHKEDSYDYTNRTELKNIDLMLSNLIGKGLSKKLVYSIIKDAGINSSISLSTSEMSHSPVITVNPVLEIDGTLSEAFVSNRKRIESAAVIFIDGVVETLGEIECILQSFSKEKKSLGLFARGFSPDVVSTLSKNFSMGNLYVFPIKVAQKDETLKEVESHPNFYNLNNIHELRTLTVDELDFDYSVNFMNRKTTVEGIESINRKTHITLPSYLKNTMGILEDRINFGKRLAMETASLGIASLNANPNELYSLKSVKQSFMTLNSLNKSIENLGAFVLQS